VFALLLLNRFIGEIHLPANLEELLFRLAREVPVKSQQLNNLAGDLISGVELNFDLVSLPGLHHWTTGRNKTDLMLGFLKVLNDRLNRRKLFGLEGHSKKIRKPTPSPVMLP
jgi:hypothetical protein